MTKDLMLSNMLLSFCIIFIGLMLYGLLFYIILNLKVNIKKLVFFSLCLLFPTYFIRLTSSFPLILSTSLVFLILGCVFIFRFSILKSITLAFVAQIATLICDLVTMLFFSQFNISKQQFSNNINFMILGNLIANLILILITVFIHYSNININYPENISKKRKLGILINSLITLFLISPNVIYFISSPFNFPKAIIIYNVIAIIVFFALSTYNTYKNNELELKKYDLENQKLYNKTLNDLIDGLSLFKHDFANILNCIGGYLTLNDQKGLRKYFSELIEDYNSINNFSSINATILNNPSIYGLIVSKLYAAEIKGIKIDTNITTDVNDIQMKIYDLCKILGIFLDNAIEAAHQSAEKTISLSIKKDENYEKYFIAIENSFPGNVNINEIFKKGISSKGDGRGLGLWEVKSLTEKYKSVTLRTTVKGQTFRQELAIDYNILKAVV